MLLTESKTGCIHCACPTPTAPRSTPLILLSCLALATRSAIFLASNTDAAKPNGRRFTPTPHAHPSRMSSAVLGTLILSTKASFRRCDNLVTRETGPGCRKAIVSGAALDDGPSPPTKSKNGHTKRAACNPRTNRTCVF